MKMSFEREILEKRQERLKARQGYSEAYEKSLTNRIMADFNASEQSGIQQVIEFAKSIDYSHPGLDANQYFLHPLRVAALASEYVTDRRLETVKCAIVHNVLEVSALPFEDLSAGIGEAYARVVQILTVDRSKASSAEYKQAYYSRIDSSYEASAVKSLDKFDNIFLLCLNPNEATRSAYLEEIRNYVLPLVEKTIPSLYGLFREAVEDAERTRELTGDKSIALFGVDYT